MDEVYTCPVCKGQSFSIHEGFIKCSQEGCETEYELPLIVTPNQFNDQKAWNLQLVKKRG